MQIKIWIEFQSIFLCERIIYERTYSNQNMLMIVKITNFLNTGDLILIIT